MQEETPTGIRRRKRRGGEFSLGDRPGLGLDLDENELAAHSCKKNAFPSLWDKAWLSDASRDTTHDP